MVQPLTDDAGNQYAYIGLPASLSNRSVDYVAASLAVQSQRPPVTTRCFNAASPISGSGANQSCDFAIKGFISTTENNTMELMYLTTRPCRILSREESSMPDSYYFAAVMSVNQNLGRNQDLIHNPEITSGLRSSVLFVILCNAAVFDLLYTSANGVVTQVSMLESNPSTTSVVMGTQAYTHLGDAYLLQRISLDVW
ncbi:hypothetical protein J3458_015628 [Metarhizium acridum]|uniref:uncharacterized protein n=1 Tax=Metarhizium acridum TaxID=92637 RepID=UPI001C6BF421|nr:hypothetical protein J3458_015628 [Metarhizium acridum]